MTATGRFGGRHALVTGGGRGIGAAIARALKDEGATVTILGRTEATLVEAVAAGVAHSHAVADVTDAAALARAVEGAAAHAPLDIVIANAGQAESAPLKRTDRAFWDRLIAVDLTSVFDTMRLTVPAMAERGRGRFVAVASIAGLTGKPYIAAYCAAKHGVVGLVRAVASEYATTGVTVNAVCPGYVETDLVRESIARIRAKTGKSDAEIARGMYGSAPIQRFVTVEEVAGAVAWLCSDAAASVTGAAIPVAGGEVN
jgi:NAD(P)-dependent dehydrogenase (short-subunit alcohol dehydrogenase family)